MYVIDRNNQITRNSDSKVIQRDIASVDYQNFLFVQRYKIDPASGAKVNNLVNLHPSHD